LARLVQMPVLLPLCAVYHGNTIKSVPTFEVYSGSDVESTNIMVRAATDPVAVEMFVLEPSFSNVIFVSNLVIQCKRYY
jgi:hypothetical protein